MRKILIASHGNLAKGMLDTLKFFIGDRIDIQAICAYTDEKTLEEKLNDYFIGVDECDEVLIFTDLLGGSVNQKILGYQQRSHTHVIAGMFLGVILELCLDQDHYLENAEVEEILKRAKQGIVYMNNFCVDITDIDD